LVVVVAVVVVAVSCFASVVLHPLPPFAMAGRGCAVVAELRLFEVADIDDER
jgi:hypothetical protein